MKSVFIVNAGSKTVSRVLSTGSNIFVDSAVAGAIPTGSPSDTDSNAGWKLLITAPDRLEARI